MRSQNRRTFLKTSGLIGGSIGLAPTMAAEFFGLRPGIPVTSDVPAEGWIRVGCPAHNCGGRCLLKVWVKDGLITRIETDDRPTDNASDPQLRACVRGRAYRRRQ